ncbi:DUF3859 domain-containing protein [Aestuariibius sp. HNIBRBA575]|uniref:DUF3859 domain-containing protein n=1 Tax=Aestuariibius sp. HNIBRBA575 TaxID=3233343 RepID=UPI0034A4C166
MFRFAVPAAGFIATFAHFAFAQVAEDYIAPQIAFLEAGIVCETPSTGTRVAPDTAIGYIDVIEGSPDFISNSRVVPAVPGIHFGIKASIMGDADLDGITIHTYHPPFKDTGLTHQQYQTSLAGSGPPSGSYYGLDFDYEVVTGTWVFEAEFEGFTLYRVAFELVDPTLVPELAEACNYSDLFS